MQILSVLFLLIVLIPTSAIAQEQDALRLCTPSLASAASINMPDVVPYLDEEDRTAFTQRIFKCRLPDSQSQ